MWINLIVVFLFVGTDFVLSVPFKFQENNSRQFRQGYSVQFSPADAFDPRYSNYRMDRRILDMGNLNSNSNLNSEWKKEKFGKSGHDKMANSMLLKEKGSKSNFYFQKYPDQNYGGSVVQPAEAMIRPSSNYNSVPVEGEVDNGTKNNLALLANVFTQGLNPATVEKLTTSLDEQVPRHVLNLFKNFVAAGNRLVGLWDEKMRFSRDGQSGNLGTFEMVTFALDQMKKLSEGQGYTVEDGVSQFTTPSEALLQGMIMVKRLTKRILGNEDRYGGDEVREVKQNRRMDVVSRRGKVRKGFLF